MSKFKVGDKVKIHRKEGNTTGCYEYRDRKFGWVNEARSDDCVVWSEDLQTEYFGIFDFEELELVEDRKCCIEGCNNKTFNKGIKNGKTKYSKKCRRHKGAGEWKDVLSNGFLGELGDVDVYVSNNINNNEQTTSSENKCGKIMSRLTSFVKNSLLSADEKLLRKYDLKDSCGDYTSEAEQLVMQKLMKDNESYLVEVATAMETEDKKNK